MVRRVLRSEYAVTICIITLIRLLQFSFASLNNPKYFSNHVRPFDDRASGAADWPLILPLSYSAPNSTSLRGIPDRNYRRLLSDPSDVNAQMPLYDDLLTNGYYTTRLHIGTPPQEFALIVDSGSTVTYVPCSSCTKCGTHQDPRFQPNLSSTYAPVKCHVGCNCDEERQQCQYERRYAEQSSSSGLLGEDVISFGDQSHLRPQRAIFGCENAETGDLFSQRADGIMGLGRGRLSIIDQLVNKGAISDSFSLCYGGMDVGGGAMMLGKYPPLDGMVFSPMDPSRSAYYNIELKAIHVDGKALKLNPKIFDRKHGTVLDSGTTYAYLPPAAFRAFKKAVMKSAHSVKQIPGPDPTFPDICFSVTRRDVSDLSKIFPEVEMEFGNGHKLSLSPENYLFRHTKVHGAYCLGLFTNGNDGTTLLGGIIVRNTLVTYDIAHKRIGFWKTNCSELWKNQNVPQGSAPEPQNDSENLLPASSLDKPIDDVFPGQLQAGHITFDLSFKGNSSGLQTNLTHLTVVIAKELEINVSQVHVLNFTSEENYSVVRLGIYPDGPAGYFPETRAKGIISLFVHHHMQLPERFSSYQLVDWKVEPQTTEKSWLPGFWAIFVGATWTLVIFSSVTVLWFWWRYRREAQSKYEPIGAAVSEQERQQLQMVENHTLIQPSVSD